ncbi:MAG: PAS domain S-box protein [Cyclobacteriaceae bacterium]|nr:PAS domain S-box protein [Cyclobacteriaceae bacterium HetDA_MAG_MS6]
MKRLAKLDQKGFKLLSSIFLSASEGIVIVDRQGIILAANPRAEILFGYDEGTMNGQKIEALVPPSIKKKHIHHRKSFSNESGTRAMGKGLDLMGLRKDGSEFPVEISLSSFENEGEMLTAAFVIDISERKEQEKALAENRAKLQQYTSELEQRVKERTHELEHLNLGLQNQVQERKIAEQALRESQKLYRTISQNFPNGIINVLDKDLTYVFIDGADMKIRGWHYEDVIGTLYLKKVGNHQKLKDRFDVLLDTGKEFSIELEIKDQYYQVHAVPLYGDPGEITQILVVEENITRQKKAESEILKSLEKEKELNEMKSRFVSMASHEFRTPLSTILSSISLIGKYPDDAREKREKHINKIRSAISNMTNILNDFLSIGKLEEGKIEVNREWINIEQMMQRIIGEFEDVLKPGQLINQQIPPNLAPVFSDPKLLNNILLNLLSNASKYSEDAKAISLSITSEDNVLIIAVSDQGLGIPVKEQKNIFNRFFRAANAINIQGTGLGLHIVKKYVELLNGSIGFQSEAGIGTTFTIKLPHAKETVNH